VADATSGNSWSVSPRENPRWGYQRIVGELKRLRISVSPTTVRKILREAGLGPARRRGGLTWREFLRAQGRAMIAVDFYRGQEMVETCLARLDPFQRLSMCPYASIRRFRFDQERCRST